MIDHPQSLIQYYRKNNGWTQREVADRLVCSPSQVHKHENGDAPMTIPWLKRYASVYNVKVSDLLMPEDKPENSTPIQISLLNVFSKLTVNQQRGVLALVSSMAKDN
ncbi:MAG: helix-turn-helix transcriptional regulator [Rhizobiales bacterium]|nr:helix-turn-helix transcriptional regulator [Hyphomicrobiales bacterium]